MNAKDRKNDCVGLKSGKIVKIENFARNFDEKPVTIGRKFVQKTDVYTYPCPLSMLDIRFVQNLSNYLCWPINEIEKKNFSYSVKEKHNLYAVFPLLHNDATNEYPLNI